MANIKKSVLIDFPIEEIYLYLLDVEEFAEWNVGLQSAEADEKFPEVGGKISMVYKSAGTTLNMAFILNELQPEKVISYKIEGMVTGSCRYTLEAKGEKTQVSVDYDYHIPGGGLGRLFDKLLLEKTNAQNLETSLDNLKELLESVGEEE